MKIFSAEKDLHELFKIGVVLKGIEGVLETVVGFLFIFVNVDFIAKIVIALTRDELAEDSNDFISNLLVHWSQNITLDTKLFIAVFLLVHGIVNLILVLGISRNKLWAYKSAIIVFALFILYQAYRFTYSHSIILGGVIIFDTILIALIAHEYKHRIEKQN